jgi:hypothetical protein
MNTTYAEILDAHQVEIPAHLEADAEIPVLAGLQRQGDIMVIPMRAAKVAGLQPVPAEGVPVVRGEAGGNTHLLVAVGPGVTWASRTATAANPDLGTLVVPDGSTAYLLHPEHGATGHAAGDYTIRRQVEAGEQARLVAD